MPTKLYPKNTHRVRPSNPMEGYLGIITFNAPTTLQLELAGSLAALPVILRTRTYVCSRSTEGDVTIAVTYPLSPAPRLIPPQS